MKWMFTALMLGTCNLACAEPFAMPLVRHVQKTVDMTMCESYKGSRSEFGQLMNKQCRNRMRAEFDSLPDEKTLKDCIKPGNVIDDDVRKCMKGL